MTLPITRKGWAKLSTTLPVDDWKLFHLLCEQRGMLPSDFLFLIVQREIETMKRQKNEMG